MNSAPAPWVFEAAQSPIAFAQVREDATLDQWVAEQLNEQSEVLMVASGGCTAAALAASSKFARLHLVDPNPAQIALSRLKLRLLETAEPEVHHVKGVQARLANLGYHGGGIHGDLDAATLAAIKHFDTHMPDVGNILNVADYQPLVDQCATQPIGHQEGAQIADMLILVHCGAAAIDPDLARSQGLENFNLA